MAIVVAVEGKAEGRAEGPITTGGTIEMVVPWLIAGYALYKGYGIYNEGRALIDYKRRYPWVRIKYPSRTKVAKQIGGALGVAGMYRAGNMYRPRISHRASYDPVKYMYA